MRECYSIQRDYSSRPEFRKLSVMLFNAGAVGSRALSHYLVTSLFQEFAYLSDRFPLGCMVKEDIAFWIETLDQTEVEPNQLVDMLVAAGYLREDGKYFVCMLFIESNERLSIYYRSPIMKQSEINSYRSKIKNYRKMADAIAAGLHPNRYSVVDGKKIEQGEMKRIVSLIPVIDSLLGRKERDESEYGDGIIQDSCRLIRRFTDQDLEIILARLVHARNTPGVVPRTAEQFIAKFDACVQRMQPDNGWGEWSLPIRESQRVLEQTPALVLAAAEANADID